MTSAHKPYSTGLESGRFKGFCENSERGQALAAALLPDPDDLFVDGEPVCSPWQTASTDKVRIRLAGQDYFVKRYNCLGIGFRLKNLLRPSRALRSWRNGLRFLQARVPTVAPLAYLEERCFGLLGRSYIVFPHLNDADSLLDCWPGLVPQEQVDVLSALAEAIGRMHRQGIFHGDLNWRNILLQRDVGLFQLFLVDLDGCHYRKAYAEMMALHDLEHFYRDMRRSAVSDELLQEFQRAWQAVVTD